MSSGIMFKQGEDKKVILLVTETPAIDFSTALDAIALIKVNNVVKTKYALQTKTGYKELIVDTTDSNKLNVFLQREDTVQYPVGAISAHLTAKFPNVDFPDGEEIKTWSFQVGRVLAGDGLDEEI